MMTEQRTGPHGPPPDPIPDVPATEYHPFGEYVFVARDPRGRVAELMAHFVITVHEIGELPFGVDDYAAVRAFVTSLVDLVREEVAEELAAHRDETPHLCAAGGAS
jgi:hypothetical protein